MESQKLIELLVLCVFYLFSSVNTASDQAYKGPTTAAGLNLIKEHEGFHSNFYTNSIIKNKIIGYGYVCHENENLCDNLRPPISISQATRLLITRLKSFESCVNLNVQYCQLTANQFSALVSFTFNLGCQSLKGSTLLKKLNRNDVSGAAADFAKWNKNGSKVVPALTKRREAERALFCSNKAC